MSALTDRIHTNGTRGRAVPALPEHTFRDSGITIRFRKIGPMTQQRMAQAIRQELDKPRVPVAHTELGPEPNPADPAYQAAVEEWEQQCATELNNRLMRLAALESEIEIGEREQAEIARKRRYLKSVGMPFEDSPDLEREENDRVLYILHIACATPDDLKEFGRAIFQRSVPTEEAVQAHVDSFPGDIQGS